MLMTPFTPTWAWPGSGQARSGKAETSTGVWLGRVVESCARFNCEACWGCQRWPYTTKDRHDALSLFLCFWCFCPPLLFPSES